MISAVRKLRRRWRERRYFKKFYNSLMFIYHEADETDRQMILQLSTVKELEEALTTLKMVKWYESVRDEVDREREAKEKGKKCQSTI